MDNSPHLARLGKVLLLQRLSVFVVMLFWTLDKFINPEHAGRVFQNFYGLSVLGTSALMVVGILELALLAGFLLGVWKRYTYGMVLVFHAISTFSSYRQYLNPFENLLFFAAWPMLAACVGLYLLRELDTKWTIS